MKENGCEPNIHTCNALMNGFSQGKLLDTNKEVERVYHETNLHISLLWWMT